MSEVYKCPGCGATSTKSWHRLTPGLTRALIKFKRAVVAKGENSVHTRRDMDGTENELTKGEYANWTKLRFLGLVAHADDAGRGYWLLTRRGNDYLTGGSVPNRAQTMNNEVQHDHGENIEWVTFEEVMKTKPFFERIEDIEREQLPIDTAQVALL